MRPVLTIGKKLEKFFILFLLIFSSGLFAKDVLVEENNNIYYKKGERNFIYLMVLTTVIIRMVFG
ncbi:hypothetical protein MY149_15370 [Acinetobacter indicus]|nr:hypothetical protein [Acinetobacter indicus]